LSTITILEQADSERLKVLSLSYITFNRNSSARYDLRPRRIYSENVSSRVIYSWAFQAIPKLYNPMSARTLNAVGRGFWDLMARGMDEPASMTDARRPSSIA
jgi:hypothetical protein